MAVDVRWWEATAREACRLLRAHHPGTYAELVAGPRTLVPVDRPGSFSGSSAEAFGAMTLSRPRSARGLALSMTHEMQHSKFAAVLHLFDLFEPRGEGALLRTVEQDPAELALTQAQLVRWRARAREAMEVLLASGRLTAPGQHFAQTMLSTLYGLCRLPLPAEAPRRRGLAAEHRAEWVRRNGVPLALLI